MSKLIYFMPMSMDGFIGGDGYGGYDWSAPDEVVFGFINELTRPIGTYLYGRKNYETMAVWETPEMLTNHRDFAEIWQAAEKVVYSRTLDSVSTSKTRIEREFDPEAVRAMKAQSPHDITVAGPILAAQAIRAGLVDEFQFLLLPVMLGRGRRVIPENVNLQLKLVEERRVGEGTVFLRYQA